MCSTLGPGWGSAGVRGHPHDVVAAGPRPTSGGSGSPGAGRGAEPCGSPHQAPTPAPSGCTQPGPAPAAALGALGPGTMSCRAGATWVLPRWEEQPLIAILEDAIKMPLLLQPVSLLFKCIHRSCALAQQHWCDALPCLNPAPNTRLGWARSQGAAAFVLLPSRALLGLVSVNLEVNSIKK